MADIATLVLRVDGSRARREVREFGEAAERSGRQALTLEQAAKALGITFGAFQAMQWARDAIALGDAWTNMNARLSLVTRGAEDLMRVQRDLFRVAQETRTPLEATAQLYELVARNQDALGLTSRDLVEVTETINQAMVISGASASSAQAALVQLGQAMASGVLRGEELNSVMEQSPRLANAIAAGMGVSIGQLKAMGEQGKLTAEAVVRAILAQREVVQTEFSQMALTVGGAWTQLRNAVLKTVGEFDSAHGGTRNLAAAISSLAENLGEVVNVASHLVAVGLLRWAGQGVQAMQQMVRGFVLARAESAAYAENRVREAAATHRAAQAERDRLQVRLASLQADRAAIQLSQQEYTARLQAANARMARAVDPASLAPLGGAVVERERLAQMKAMQEQKTAMRELAILGTQQANVKRALAQTETALAAANVQVTGTSRAMTAAMAAQTLAARAAAGAMSLLQKGVAFLGGWPAVIMMGAYAAYTAISHFREKGVQRLAEEAEKARKVMEDFKGSLEGLGSAELQAKLRETQDQIAKLQPQTFASFQQGTPTEEQNRALQEYLALYERLEHIQAALVPVQKRESDEAAERARRFGELTAARELEIDRQVALNRAHGQSQTQLALLNIEYDRRAERAKNAVDRTAAEAAQLNALTDRMAAARVEAERLAEAERERRQLSDVRAQGASEIRDAQMQLAMVEMSIEAQARYRVEMERNLRVGEAHATLTGQALEQRLRDIRTWYDLQQATFKANEELRVRNQLLSDVRARIDAGVQAAKDSVDDAVRALQKPREEIKALARSMQETLSGGLKSFFEDGVRGFADFFRRVKGMFLGLVADMLAAAMMKRVAGVLVAALGNLIPKDLLGQGPGGIAPKGLLGLSPEATANVGAGLGGAMLGYGIGRASGSAVFGAGGGAIAGAAIGSMIAPGIGTALGAAAGGLAGLIGGITGAGEAAKRARERMDAYRKSIEQMELQVAGETLALGMAQIRAETEQMLRQLGFAAGTTIAEAIELATRHGEWLRDGMLADLQRLAAVEQQRIEQLKEQHALQQRHMGEDLQVRALMAQGRDAEAEALRRQFAQERERAELIKSFGETTDPVEAALLAQLEYVHALERTAEAMSGLNREALNLPATFKMAGYVFDAMQEMTADQYRRAVFGGGPTPMPSAPPSQIPAAPIAPAAGSGGMIMVSPDQPFVVQLSNGKEIARFTLGEFRRGAAGPGKEATARVLADITVS